MKYTNEIEVAKFLETNYQLELDEIAKKNMTHMYYGLSYLKKNDQKIGYTWVKPCSGKYTKLKLINIAAAIGISFNWETNSFNLGGKNE